MAEAPRLLPSPSLQLPITEGGFGPLLGFDHIVLIDPEAGGQGQGQKGVQIHPSLQIRLQGGLLATVGEKGIELLEAHTDRPGAVLV